jgi:hypothetical protein
MSPSEADEQRERREVLENDRPVREQQQASTYFQRAITEADEPRGRFQNSGGTTTVIGRDGPPSYPQLPSSSPWSGTNPEPGMEPPLNYCIDQMSEHDPSSAVLASAEPGPASADAPSAVIPVPVDVPRADAGSSSHVEDEDNG